MTIWEQFMNGLENRVPFKVDFEERTLKLGGKILIDKGAFNGELGIITKENDEYLKIIESLYRAYKVSVPSEESKWKQKYAYFTAMELDDMTDEQLWVGKNREFCQGMLEGYFLMAVLNGFHWESKYGKWFYRNNDGLVILKQFLGD